MSSRPLCYVSFRQTCKRPQRKLRVALSSIHCMSSSSPVSPSSSVSSPPSPCSSPSPCVPHTSFQYHWSFHISCLNFLMMVLSYLTLPFSLSLSYSQSKSYQAWSCRSPSYQQSKPIRSSLSCQVQSYRKSWSYHCHQMSSRFFSSVFFLFFICISSFCTYCILHLFNLHAHYILTKTDDMADNESSINLLLSRFPLSASNNYTYGHFLLFYGTLFLHNFIKHISTCRKKNVGILDSSESFDFSPFLFASIWHCICFLLYKLGAYILSYFINCSRILLFFFSEKCRVFTSSLFFMTISIFALSNKVLTRLIELSNKYLSCSKQKYFVTSYIYCHKTLIFFVFLACFDYFFLYSYLKGLKTST